MMSGIAEIQEAILALQDNDYAQLRQWFGELDWEKWDREIEPDSEAARLGSLVAEALEAKENGTLQKL